MDEIKLYDVVRSIKRDVSITVVCKIYDKDYILVQWCENGNFFYGFKPMNQLALHVYGIGTTTNYSKNPEIKKDGLYGYLAYLIKTGGKIYVYYDLSDHFKDYEYFNRRRVVLDKPEVEVSIKINGKETNKKLSVETARNLGLIE